MQQGEKVRIKKTNMTGEIFSIAGQMIFVKIGAIIKVYTENELVKED